MIINLRQGFSKVRNQYTLGSCVGMAGAGVLDYIRNRINGWYTDSLKKDYSPRYLYYHLRPRDYYQPGILLPECPIAAHAGYQRDMDSGSNTALLKRAIIKFGTCDENDWDYKGCDSSPSFKGHRDHIKNKFAIKPTVDVTQAKQNVWQWARNIELFDDDADRWIQELQNDNPVIIGIGTPFSWDPDKGPYFYDMQEPDSGGHAIVIVGYDSAYPDPANPGNFKEAFLIRNSWGPAWRNRGYIWVSRESLVHMASLNIIKSMIILPNGNYVPFQNPNNPTPQPMPPTPTTPHGPGPSPQPTPTQPPGPTPAPQPTPTQPPGPTPTPQPAPQPTPAPQPVPQPGPGPHHSEFIYQWWLFNDKAEFDLADTRSYSPYTLRARNLGRKLNGPGRHDEDRFGLNTTGVNRPNKGTPVFTDIDELISDPNNAGKWVGLGACRPVDITEGRNPVAADGFWKWDGKKITVGGHYFTIITQVNGNLGSPQVFVFKVTDPEGNEKIVRVSVPAGINPKGESKVHTMLGKHTVEESKAPGFISMSQIVLKDVDVTKDNKANALFVNRIKADDKEHLIIKKRIEGEVDAHILINFKVTMPDNSEKTITVTVPPGKDPVGHKTIETMHGLHKVEEPDLVGFDPASPKVVELDIKQGEEGIVEFKNKVKNDDAPPATRPRIIPLKNANLPHPPHHGTREPIPFRVGEVMSIPDSDSGAKTGKAGTGEIDFLLWKNEGKSTFGWVCYLIRESDGEIMKPTLFNLRIVLSQTKGKYTYTGKGSHHGYNYNRFTTGKLPSTIESKNKITFNPYLNIDPNVQPGYYKLVLEIAKWPESWKGRIRSLKNPELGELEIIDQNYIRLKIDPAEEGNN